MAQLKEIIENEKQRDTIEFCRMAHLYREGNFLRAYEWSAWLFVKYINDFKVTNRIFKALGEAVAMIGFPPSSLEKFTPKEAQVDLHEDGSITLVLSAETIPDGSDISELFDEYHKWKSSLPISESNSSKKERQNPSDDPAIVETVCTPSLHQRQTLTHHTTLTGIMQQILAFPLEQKSPMECMSFLSEIKRQISSII